MQQVTFHPSFFVKTARRDYTNPTEAFLREFIQNSRDAGATKIDMTLEEKDGQLVFGCIDNGSGMDESTIREKLMVVVATTKDESNTSTGGFGVAKIIIYFAQNSYTLHTRDLLVKGVGSGYAIERAPSYRQGVAASVVLNPEVISGDLENLAYAMRRELQRSYLPGIHVTLNGETVICNHKAGYRASDLSIGHPAITVHKRKLGKGETVSRAMVRVRGLHMFSVYCGDMKHEVILELDGYSTELLTSNRDGFVGQWRDKISELLQTLTLNSQAGECATSHFWRGESSRVASIVTALAKVNRVLEQIRSTDLPKEEVVALVKQELEGSGEHSEVASALIQATERHLDQYIAERSVRSLALTKEDVPEVRLAHNYYVWLHGDFRKVPKAWEPHNFNSKQTAILELWAKIIAMVMSDAGFAGRKFDVGYILDDGTDDNAPLALYKKRQGENGVFLLNPRRYDKNPKLPGIRSEALIWYLVDLACHEVTHYRGYDWHNEGFVSSEGALRRKVLLRYKAYLALRKVRS